MTEINIKELIEKFGVTQDHIELMVQSFVGMYTLGEVIDNIEYGMTAYSVSDSDKGFAFGVDKVGNVFMFDSNDFLNGIEPEIWYGFSVKKSNTAIEKRYMMFNHGEELLIYSDEEENK